MVLKSKLFAIGFLMQDNLRCDENNNCRGPSQSAEPNDKSQECEQMIKAWFSYVADDRRVIVSDHSRRKYTKDFTHE